MGRTSVTITRQQLEQWAGRPLTDNEVGQVQEALPNASVPEAIATIIDYLNGDDR
jgi:hypothetical protein